jgi:hypothetical protein
MVIIVVASSHLSKLWDVVRQMVGRSGLAAHIEFKNTWHHNDRLRPIAILKHCELECLGAIDKKSAAAALIVLDYPIAPAVFSDHEEWNSRTRFGGGRLDMFHDTSPLIFGQIFKERNGS